MAQSSFDDDDDDDSNVDGFSLYSADPLSQDWWNIHFYYPKYWLNKQEKNFNNRQSN